MNSSPRVYSPQPVFIPENAGIKRNMIVNDAESGDPDVRLPLHEEVRSQYDSCTLFYDMFFKSGDLICLGPPFRNLGTPTAVYCDGKPVSFTCNCKKFEIRAPSVLRLRLPLGKDRERLNLRFSFPEFEATASLDTLRAHRLVLPFRDLCLHTLQKDNPGEWIRDWCLWHHRAHGVQRVIIYDNGSRDFPELDGAFAGVNKELEIILVHWPFPYGPTNRYWYKFCRPGALNHFRLFWGDVFRWGINLDVDEYLHINAEQRLREFLAQPGQIRKPVIRLGSLKFPAPDVRRDVLPRFFHHKMHISDRKRFWSEPKYIFQSDLVSYCSVHFALPRRASSLQRIYQCLQRALHRLRSFGMLRMRVRKDKDSILFHHYFGLYNGWRGWHHHKPGVDAFPPGALVENRDVSKLAARLGLTEAASCAEKRREGADG